MRHFSGKPTYQDLVKSRKVVRHRNHWGSNISVSKACLDNGRNY
jgi:hypothetical protein